MAECGRLLNANNAGICVFPSQAWQSFECPHVPECQLGNIKRATCRYRPWFRNLVFAGKARQWNLGVAAHSVLVFVIVPIMVHQCIKPPEKTITARFYQLVSGREPVWEWLKSLPIEDRKIRSWQANARRSTRNMADRFQLRCADSPSENGVFIVDPTAGCF